MSHPCTGCKHLTKQRGTMARGWKFNRYQGWPEAKCIDFKQKKEGK